MKHLFTIREVAEQTGMSVTTIRRSLAHIPHYRREGKKQILFSQEQIEKLVNTKTQLYVPKQNQHPASSSQE